MYESQGLFQLLGHRERETIERELGLSFADIYDLIDDVLFETSELEKMLRRLFRGEESPEGVEEVR
jgi:hypothetical protein